MKLKFDAFWQLCQEKLNVDDVIPNWSVSGNIRTKEFKISEIMQDSISYDSPTAENIQKVSKTQFEEVFDVWDKYKNGNITRAELRNNNNKTTYIIATIRYLENLEK